MFVTHVSIVYTDPPANECGMVLCHINLNLEYAQLHNKTAANNHVLHIVYKTLLFIKCIMCLYSGPEAAYYQINQ